MARSLILVVEDDRGLRDLYRTALGLSGYDVHVSEDGLDALRYLEDHRPDLIVLDLDLPKIPGVTLYSELRFHPSMRAIPILVVTGTDPLPDLREVKILRKPCPPEALIDTIQAALRGPSSLT